MTSPLASSTIRNVAIYGGGFDPPTLGHERCAEVVHAETGMPIWMMPCYEHLFSKKLSDATDRLAMIGLLAKQHNFIVPCSHEIDVKHAGSMYETLTNLSKIHPDIRFHFIVGMDNANNIQQWHKWENLITEFSCFVVTRSGCPASSDWWQQPPHRSFVVDIDTSSTDVRVAIKNGQYDVAKQKVPSCIWDYIVEHKLYGYGS